MARAEKGGLVPMKTGKSTAKGCYLSEVTKAFGIERNFAIHCIEARWVIPARSGIPLSSSFLDEEDVARLELIRDLREHMGVNDEGISVALHLLDQIYALRARIHERSK
jgi:chaperone modulatory protein CbpM